MGKTPGGREFYKTEDYKIAPELEIRNFNLHYPNQTDLFEKLEGFEQFRDDPRGALRVKIGYFFELLAQGMYGGKGNESKLFFKKMGEDCVSPDLVDFNLGIVREAKATSLGKAINLLDQQIARYASLQKAEIIENPQIYFDIFRHGIKDVEKKHINKGVDYLISELSSQVLYSISLPFSIVFTLWEKGKSRKETAKYPPCTIFHSSNINSFLLSPKKTLENLGFSTTNFIFKKAKFPTGVTINKQEINPFPILLIKDKDSKRWIQEFKTKYEKIDYQSFLERNFSITDDIEEEIPF